MGQDNETNFEINLLPVISLLAVIIGFLLVSAVWIPLGGFHVKQAIGETADKTDSQKESKFQINLISDSVIALQVESEGRMVQEIKIKETKKDYSTLKEAMAHLKIKYPQVTRVFLMPASQVKYQNVVSVFSLLSELELKEVGLQPTL